MRTRLPALIGSFVWMVSLWQGVNGVFAQQQTTIAGKILGHGGEALPKAHVHLVRPNQEKAFTTVEAAEDGSYSLVTNETGLFFAQFTGVNHEKHDVPLDYSAQIN